MSRNRGRLALLVLAVASLSLIATSPAGYTSAVVEGQSDVGTSPTWITANISGTTPTSDQLSTSGPKLSVRVGTRGVGYEAYGAAQTAVLIGDEPESSASWYSAPYERYVPPAQCSGQTPTCAVVARIALAVAAPRSGPGVIAWTIEARSYIGGVPTLAIDNPAPAPAIQVVALIGALAGVIGGAAVSAFPRRFGPRREVSWLIVTAIVISLAAFLIVIQG